MATGRTLDISKLKVSCQNCSLSELCLPRSLSPDEVEELDAIVKRGRILDRGEHIFEEQDPFASLYVVRSGSLKASMSTPEGLEQIVAFHLPGELIGLDGFHEGVHHCSAEALETTSLCGLPTDKIQDLCQSIKGLDQQFHRLLARELAQDQTMLLLLGKGTAEERVAAFLVSLSRRYAERGFSPREFNLSMSRHEIGNFLGLALETVSRQFAKLQSSGVLTVNRRAVEINDPDHLHALVGECRDNPSRSSA